MSRHPSTERPDRAPAAHRSDGRRRGLTISSRLDEARQPLHDVFPAKLVLVVGGSLGASLALPWTWCVAWAVVSLGLEVWLWLSTAPPSKPRRPSAQAAARARLRFTIPYALNNVWWLVLAALFWSTGEPTAMATAAAMTAVIAMVGVMLFHNVPIVFYLTGAAPAVAAMVVLVMADGRSLLDLGPVWFVIGLGGFFAVGRALETPSAQEAQRRINESLEKYETLEANITDVIARTALDGCYQYVSPAAADVLGYTPEELVGTSRWDYLHPDTDHSIFSEALDRLRTHPQASETLTVRVRHKDGRWIWLQSRGRLILENDIPVATIDVSRDVTAQVAAQAALKEAKSEAEAATRAKAEFLANVSHEIRTPMNGVLGALQALDGEPISAEGRELLRRAEDCGRMLSQLLNDVLDFSKIEAGQLDLAPEALDVGEALGSVVGLLEGQARAKGVTLTCDIQGSDLWIEADPVRLRQAMFNLLGNAVKFTPVGQVTARLSVRDGAPGRRQVRLEVEDTGIGIAPEAQARLFERFHQAENDTARRFGGAGLGLSITRALVSMMGGHIGFRSVEGQGSTFWIAFDAPSAKLAPPPELEDPVLSGVNVLVVEDNATNRLVVRTLLTRLGATVSEACDGLAGVEAARRGGFDLILMDIQMPHMCGIEATRAIRGLPGPEARTPILALTANAMLHQRAEYLASGMDGMVAKPIAVHALLAEIARLLDEPQTELAATG
ncbi:MAG: ATP-binding protein [Phenylobacterium sp.]|nr:ATP-binding protein [Phenylobacterium sp.]